MEVNSEIGSQESETLRCVDSDEMIVSVILEFKWVRSKVCKKYYYYF